MARPRLVRLEHGEVSLNGFPAEVATALVEHIKKFGQQQGTQQESDPEEQSEQITESVVQFTSNIKSSSNAELDMSHLKHKAFGIYKDPNIGNKLSLVTISYDLNTNQAMISGSEFGDGLRDTTTKLKIAVGNLIEDLINKG